MVTEVRVTAQSLDDIVAHEVSAMFRRFAHNRDVIIGLVGDRGSGKSLSGANIAVRDYAMSKEPLFSNMSIALGVNVNDDIAMNYGLPQGGMAVYESEPLDKQQFLALDERYEGGCLFFDEFNLEYGEARRSTANVNLMTDRAIQQLRKMQCALVYTVINEMYMDSRIRDNTDLFIRCRDTAFKPENLRKNMQQGVAFEWMLYPMTPRLLGYGNTFTDTGKPIGPIPVTLRNSWGIIDTLERQAAGKTKYTESAKELMKMQLKDAPEVVAAKRDPVLMELEKRLDAFWARHANDGEYIEITSKEWYTELGVEKDDWPNIMKYYLLKHFFKDEESLVTDKRGNYTIKNRILVGV